MSVEDKSWAFITGFYYPKFLIFVKNMVWDERYRFLRGLYDDANPEQLWEERSTEPVKDMMEYVLRKDYLHFFCMGFTVKEDGRYTVHRAIRDMMYESISI